MVNIFKHLKSTFVLGLLLSLPIGMLASYLANKLTNNGPRLTVEASSSTNAGLTVTDILIRNGGIIPLGGLKAEINFSSPIDYKVQPQRFASCSRVVDSLFTLTCPKEELLEPSGFISMRFTGTEDHSIRNQGDLPNHIAAEVLSAPIKAEWQHKGMLGQYLSAQTLVGALIVLVVVLLGALVWSLKRSAPGQQLTPSNPGPTHSI